MSRMRSIRRGQRGNALVEYALLLSLVALTVVAGLTFFGQSVSADVGMLADEVASLFDSAGSGSAGSGAGGGQGNGHGAGNGGQNNGAGNGGQDNGTGNGK